MAKNTPFGWSCTRGAQEGDYKHSPLGHPRLRNKIKELIIVLFGVSSPGVIIGYIEGDWCSIISHVKLVSVISKLCSYVCWRLIYGFVLMMYCTRGREALFDKLVTKGGGQDQNVQEVAPPSLSF